MPLSKSVLAALAAAFIAAPTFAEEAHHPGATPATPPAAAHGATTAPAGGAMDGMGMMSMRHDRMDGMHVVAPLFGVHSSGSVERVDGRLAFLKAEIGITAAQEAAWAAFADAIRDAAKRSAERPGMMAAMQAGSAPERLKALEAHLRARLETIQASSSALNQLYRELGAGQRKGLDDLLSPPMAGMMTMGR